MCLSLCMPPTTSPAVEVNGYAVRVIRVLTGIDTKDLAAALDVDRSYIARIELGHNTRVSASVFSNLCRALSLQDRRAILANPHGTAEEGAA